MAARDAPTCRLNASRVTGAERGQRHSQRHTQRVPQCHLMTGYTKIAVVGAGALGNYIVQQLLNEKAAGIVKEVVVLTREVQYPPAPLLCTV